MKVAILIPCYNPIVSGAEVFAQEVAENLVKNGDEADIITWRWDKGLSKFEVVNGVKVYRIRVADGISKIRYLSPCMEYLSLLHHVLKLDGEKNYDIIHSVGDGDISQVGTIVKKLKGKSHLISVQGGMVGKGFQNSLSGKISEKLEKWSFKNADLVHAISRSMVEQSKKLAAQKIIMVPNGVDDRLFKLMNKYVLRRKYGFSSEKKIIICVARLVPQKGIHYLIKAINSVIKGIPELRLLIIGKGEQKEELKRLIRELNLEEKVQLLGYIQHRQIPEYLGMADVFVLPSLHEPLGIAPIEAMACGVPVIGSRVGGIVDVIEHEKNGILVPPGDIKELSMALERLLQDENLRDKFIEHGLNTVKERFLWQTILLKIDKIYASLMKEEIGKGTL